MSGTPNYGIPKPIVDFIEGLVSAAVIGASGAVLGLDLSTAGTKVVAFAALTGALNAVISECRRRLIKPQA